MQRWQQIAIALVFAALGVGSGLWALSDRARRHWPTASATVQAHRQQLIPHGSAVFVTGSFTVDGRAHSFVRPWGRDESRDGRWVPPSDLPAVGSTVPVQYDPANPDDVEIGPPPPLFNQLFPTFVAALFLVTAALLLFTPAPRGDGPSHASQKHR